MSIAPAKAKEAELEETDADNGSSSEQMFAAPHKRAFVLSLLLAVFILTIYNQATHFPFINFDDDR